MDSRLTSNLDSSSELDRQTSFAPDSILSEANSPVHSSMRVHGEEPATATLSNKRKFSIKPDLDFFMKGGTAGDKLKAMLP